MNLTPSDSRIFPASTGAEPGWCIHQLFERQACLRPEAVAACAGDESITYGALNARANQLAHYLRSVGVGPETPVALCLDRSLELVVAILGILKAGGSYLPIDLAYPKERLRFMLEDTRAPVLISQQSLAVALPEHSAKVVCVDADWPSVAGMPKDNLELASDPARVAYIIYTSGSTGKPKGVLVTHRNVVRLFAQTERWFDFHSGDVWTLFHSYAFDFSVWEIWGALLYGGRLVVVPYLVSRWPEAFYELLGKEQVTVLNQTPSAFRQLMRAEATASAEQKLALRYVIFGGEALELQSLKPWFERHGDQRPQLVNMYGITETTVHVTYRPIRAEDLSSGLRSPIGVPIPDLQLHLLDKDLQPVAPGAIGEMFIGGAGVARGYLNRPELTAQRFLPDPFSDMAGATLYRSGDLAQYTASGELEYLGRADEQIKIRGFRIELGEIEAALNQHPGVRESVVVAQESGSGDKRLAAYVVSGTSHSCQTELREFLAHKIPEYMIPALFVFLEALPLTPNGKVDRRALPVPDRMRPELQARYLGARNPTEQGLVEIWQKVLELEPVGVEDNFFDLGGDSIRSIAVLSQAQERGLSFSLQQLFKTPTIAGLAACCHEAKPKERFRRTEPFSLISAQDRAKLPSDVEDAYPMIELQTGMFYYNELNPLSAVYHDVFSFQVRSALDAGKLEQSVRSLVSRHPVLRTSFHIGEYSQPLQLVHGSVEVPFTVEDLRSCAASDLDRKLVGWIEAEKRRPFDRSKPPLLRFHVQHREENVFQLIVSFHHVYLDGWSLALLVTEILQDYAGGLAGKPVELAAPRMAYREFVALEQQAARSEESRRFWSGWIKDATVQMLPRWPKDRRTGGHEQMRGPELPVNAKTLAGLKQLAQSAGVPLKTVLLAAHQRVMGLLYGQTDVLSGLVCNGRPEQTDGDKIIGLFLNTLPIRVSLEGGTWMELVEKTFAAEQAILPHRRVPLAEIQTWNNGQPLFEAAFDFVHFHVYKDLPGYEAGGFMEGHYFEANNLTTLTTFMLDVTSTELQMHIDYDPNLLCREQVEQFSNYYLSVLQAMAADPRARHDGFCPLSAAEKETQLVRWNSTEQPYPRKRRIDELFEEQAEQTPEATALVFGKERLSYRELKARAEEVAGRLQAAGLTAGARVGVFLDRSERMVVGLLAVLRAGAAYVPLDPSFPRERLSQMIADAQCSLLLTEHKLCDCVPESAATVMEIDGAASGSSLTLAGRSPAPGSSEELAYVIYTSGSTGRPKGVQVEHRAVVNLLSSIAEITGFGPQDRMLAVTTFSFDIAALEIFLPLMRGGQVILAGREQAADGLQLCSLVASSVATAMQGTPATWRLLLEAGWNGNKKLKVFCGGEALSRNLADALLERAGEVWNLYGPTETTIWSTIWRVQPGESVLIGRPVANTQAYILDRQLQPVPVGVVGELHLGGDGLARGYLNRPELTAEKFIAHPFGKDKAARLYKTGDLARYMPDGQIECLGRMDHQVKIRGFRIELGEIEGSLRQHPFIKEALVMSAEGEPRQLVAYVILQAGASVSNSEIREFLQAKLPDYMVPAAYIRLEAWPLTGSGKIDRKALPLPDGARPDLRKAYVAPRTPSEREIARIWQEVFKIDQIGTEDNFFDLGGHSLSAIQIVVRIRETLGVELPLGTLFEAPTVSSLAIAVLNRWLNQGDAELGRVVDEIAQMSDEEAKELLRAQTKKEE